MKRRTYTRTTFNGRGVDGYRPYRGTSPADVAAAALDAAIDRIKAKRPCTDPSCPACHWRVAKA